MLSDVLYKWKWNVYIVYEILYGFMKCVSIVSEMLYKGKSLYILSVKCCIMERECVYCH